MAESIYDIADEVTEFVIAREKPAFRDFNWRDAIPTGLPPAHLGYASSQLWQPIALEILDRFNRRLVGIGRPTINVTNVVLRSTAGKPLGEFSTYLGSKAAFAKALPIISAFKNSSGAAA